MFSRMLEAIKHDVISDLSKVQVRTPEDMAVEQREQHPEAFQYRHDEFAGFGGEEPEPEAASGSEEQAPFVRSDRKIGRNEPCPCGSGKKYKQCHGKLN